MSISWKYLKCLFVLFVAVVSMSVVSSGLTFAATPGSGSSTSGGSDAAKEACAGLEDLGVDCDAGGQTAQEVASKPIKSLINTLSIVVGGVAVIMLIYGGFKFVTSGGDSDGTKKARNTIIYAAVGLAIVLLAQSIVIFVFSKASELQTPATPPATPPTSSVMTPL